MSSNVLFVPTGSALLSTSLIVSSAPIPFVPTASKNQSKIIPIKSFAPKILNQTQFPKSTSTIPPKRHSNVSLSNIKTSPKPTISNALKLSLLTLTNCLIPKKCNWRTCRRWLIRFLRMRFEDWDKFTRKWSCKSTGRSELWMTGKKWCVITWRKWNHWDQTRRDVWVSWIITLKREGR